MSENDSPGRELLRRIEELEEPWKDEEVLRELYCRRGLSARRIAYDVFDGETSNSTVNRALHRHDLANKQPQSMIVKPTGHVAWSPRGNNVYVHRLLAVAEYGLEAVRDKHVHHKNGIPWDNRPENLEILTNSEHQWEHRTIRGNRRRQIADVYHETERSSRDVASEFDVSSGTVLRIHDEVYGGGASA